MHDGCIHVKSGQPCAPLTGRGHVDTAWRLLCPRGIQIHMYEFIHFLKIYLDVSCVRRAYCHYSYLSLEPNNGHLILDSLRRRRRSRQVQ